MIAQRYGFELGSWIVGDSLTISGQRTEEERMIIAVASGKGGTGKTTISAALAEAADTEVMLLDCDVEEPNAHIFIKAQDKKRAPGIDWRTCDR